MRDEELLAVAEFRSSALFSEREKLAMEYAEAMTATPVRVPEELFAALRQHFDENQLVELSFAIAYENMRSRFLHALEVESEGLYVCALPQPGEAQRRE
jgi:alkylhydroperoxidase family enzyme